MSNPLWTSVPAKEYDAEPWKSCPYMLELNEDLKCRITQSKVTVEVGGGAYQYDGGYHWDLCKMRKCLFIKILESQK